MKTLISAALAALLVLGSFGAAQAAGLSKTAYKSAKQAALRGGAYFLTKNRLVRETLGNMNRRRVKTSGAASSSATGVSTRYQVQSRKYMPGQGPAEVKVAVRKLNNGTYKFYKGNGAGKVVIKEKPASSLSSYWGGE